MSLDKINNKNLLNAYDLALKLELDELFINLLFLEIRERGLVTQNASTNKLKSSICS